MPTPYQQHPQDFKNHTLVLDANDLPGDKSITHRAYILTTLCNNNSIIENPSLAEDCEHTRLVMQSLGGNLSAPKKENNLFRSYVKGRGLKLKKPAKMLYIGNSGTALRLITGLLAAQDFDSQMTGDNSIQKRPMDRIIDPLSLMNVRIQATVNHQKRCAPLLIEGNPKLKGIAYDMPIASAQVKSSLLLAGLYAQGKTTVIEPAPSRDHSEKLLRYLGADILTKNNIISITPHKTLRNPNENSPIFIPNDFSAAAFFIILAAASENCTFILRKVSLNPQRCKLLNVLKTMGLNYFIENRQEHSEAYGDIIVNSSKLYNVQISKEHIAQFIDEIPILAIAGCFAQGRFCISGAKELRVKECDRIMAMVKLLRNMGATVEEQDDGFSFEGPVKIKDFHCQSFGDHRIAMSAIIAAHIAKVKVSVDDIDCIQTSFPRFLDCLKKCYDPL